MTEDNSGRVGEVAKVAVEADSAVYKRTFYGILNAQGSFWTPLAFDSEARARMHIEDFWRLQPEKMAQCLRTHKIVPVRVRLTLLPEAEAND